MPPKKRTAEGEATSEGAASSDLRRSTRGGGHKQAEPVEKAPKKPASAGKAKKAKTDGSNGDAPADPTTTGTEGKPAEELVKSAEADAKAEGVEVPEANKDAAEAKGAKRIEIGETIPEGITLKTDEDKDVSITELVKEKGAVFFVYPKANTPGCTTQACLFRDHYAEFAPLGYEVFGLSSDSPKQQASWKTKHGFTYPLLCDPGQILLSLLGASKGKGSNQRSHYIVAKGGKLVDAKYTVSPKDSVNFALEFIKSQQ